MRRTRGPFLYFAYGSNMLSGRLRERCPSAEALGAAYVEGYRLAWHKRGRDGSGKCDAEATGNPGDRLHGVLWTIRRDEEAALDHAEGLGTGYDGALVTAHGAAGTHAGVKTYIAIALGPNLRPFDWYKAYVLHGAREHRLPERHIAAIAAIEARPDPDAARAAREAKRSRRIGIVADAG